MIEVQGLVKQYGKFRAVDDLTFTVKPGVVTGFLGPNGAGKSTTMRSIVGLDTPTSGKALVNGKQYRELKKPLHTVGTLLDAKWVHPNRSARAHLHWIAASNGISKTRVTEVLEIVGLDGVAHKPAGGFSLGMGQRLGLATALLGDPEILMFDEPVHGLDPEGILWVRRFMQSLAAEGRTVLVSSHMLSEMALTADHLIVIGRGKLVADQTTREFIKSASESKVIVRTEYLDELEAGLKEVGITGTRGTDLDGRDVLNFQDVTTDEIGPHAASLGVPLLELSQQQASLEDAFMRMTGDAVDYHGKEFGDGSDADAAAAEAADSGAEDLGAYPVESSEESK